MVDVERPGAVEMVRLSVDGVAQADVSAGGIVGICQTWIKFKLYLSKALSRHILKIFLVISVNKNIPV